MYKIRMMMRSFLPSVSEMQTWHLMWHLSVLSHWQLLSYGLCDNHFIIADPWESSTLYAHGEYLFTKLMNNVPNLYKIELVREE